MKLKKPINEKILETILEKVEDIQGTLKQHDARFDAVDARFDAHDKRFDAMDARFDAHDKRFDAHDARFDAHDTRFDANDVRHDEVLEMITVLAENMDRGFKEVKSDIAVIKATMVTKDYLDEKLADTRGETNLKIRKADTKTNQLVEALNKEKSLSTASAKRILALNPLAS